MLRLGAERDEVAVVDDQRGSPTYVGHLAEATRELVGLPFGVYHVAADGDCTWADFAEAIFEEAGLDCRVRRITSRRARPPRPAPGELGAPQREAGDAPPPPLAGRPARLPVPNGALVAQSHKVGFGPRPAQPSRTPCTGRACGSSH